MKTILSLLKSKKFWTLVTALVAALSAFFLSSCAASARVQREGIHIDTVRVDYIIRSRNVQTMALCPFKQTSPTSIPKFFPSTPVSTTSIASVLPMSCLEIPLSGISTSSQMINFSKSLPLSSFTRLITAGALSLNCLEEPVLLSFPAIYHTFGEKCLIALTPIAFVRRSRRRGGRKGRPRPSTKNIPLGGSHL